MQNLFLSVARAAARHARLHKHRPPSPPPPPDEADEAEQADPPDEDEADDDAPAAKRLRAGADLFAYPEPDGYAAIVEAVPGLPSPDKWRRELSSSYRAPHAGAPTYRLYARRMLFPGRCAVCKKNNKSLSHCVLGQGAKNAADAGSVHCDTLLKAQKFVYVNHRIAAEDEAAGRPPAANGGVFVFPHETDIDNPKKLYRVSQQHSFPPFDALLRQEPFATHFAPEAFAPFFHAPVAIARGKKFPSGWDEPGEKHEARAKKFRDALAEADDATRRRKTAAALTACYLALVHTHCSPSCARACESRVLKTVHARHACETCKAVRGALKKHYVTTMTKTVSGVLNKLFVERKGPFAGCPATLGPDGFVDEHCRVRRVEEATAP